MACLPRAMTFLQQQFARNTILCEQRKAQSMYRPCVRCGADIIATTHKQNCGPGTDCYKERKAEQLRKRVR